MNHPERDQAQGFAAFGPSKRRRGRFARSWWGNAWVEAVEENALDPLPLRQGRADAHAGCVGPITLSAGRIAAPVCGDHSTHTTVVGVATLGDAEWERFLDQVATRSGYVAALLAHEMPRELVGVAAEAGVALLPGMGEVDPKCSCEGWEHPCRHAAALCLQVAWLLDTDPLLLLLVRGRGRGWLLARLDERAAGERAGVAAGVAARRVYAEPAAALPEAPEAVPAPEGVAWAALEHLVGAPQADPVVLEELAVRAAQRARALLGGQQH